MTDVNGVLKRFDNPDELREFDKGKFEFNSPTYQSRVNSHERGHCHKTCRDGSLRARLRQPWQIVEMKPGDLFYVPPSPHDNHR